MSEDILTRSVNKGVPSYANIQLRCEDLLHIVKNQEELAKLLQDNFEKVLAKIRRPEDPDLLFSHFKTLETVIGKDGISREICFSSSMLILSSLCFLLNANNTCYTKRNRVDDTAIISIDNLYDMIYQPIIDRLEKLEKTSNIHTIKREFPMLYNAYDTFSKYYFQFKKVADGYKKYANNPHAAFLYKRKFIDSYGSFLPEGFDTLIKKTQYLDFNRYKSQAIVNITHLLEDYEKSDDIIKSHPLDFSTLNDEDLSKIELYSAYRFLRMAKLVEEEYRQSYLYYVSSYLHEHKELKNSDLAINVGLYSNEFEFLKYENPNGEVITYNTIYEQYRQLLIDNPTLCDISFSNLDFGNMTMEEINEFMDQYLSDLSVNWELLPDEKYITSSEKEKKLYEAKLKQNNKDYEKAYNLFMEKKMYFDSSNPLMKIKGKHTFSGYIGFIYANGKVILDRFYQNAKKGSIVKGAAIYIMNLENFYEMSKLSKKFIIHNNLCRRVVHKGNWQDLLTEEITAEANVEEVATQAQLLIRRLTDKKE